MTIHDNADTWRDLTEQLTPKQIAELEYCEREGVPPCMTDPRQGLLNIARAEAQRNLIQVLCADIAPPTYAVGGTFDWEERGPKGFGRMFTVSTRAVGETAVEVCGVQFDDGHVELALMLAEAPEDISASDARALAAALVEAADEMDRLG